MILQVPTYPDNPVKLEDVGIHNVALILDSGIQAVVNKEDAEIQATVTTAEASTDIITRLLVDKDIPDYCGQGYKHINKRFEGVTSTIQY